MKSITTKSLLFGITVAIAGVFSSCSRQEFATSYAKLPFESVQSLPTKPLQAQQVMIAGNVTNQEIQPAQVNLSNEAAIEQAVEQVVEKGTKLDSRNRLYAGASKTKVNQVEIATKALSANRAAKLNNAFKTWTKAKMGKNASKGGDCKNWAVCILLCFFVGSLGIHRFYMGYTWQGIVQLLTLGGLGIWTLIDFIRIILKDLKPKNGDYC